MSISYFDVEAMIRDARSSIRAEIDRVLLEIQDELAQMLAEERAMRQDAIDSVYRVLNARTDHLV